MSGLIKRFIAERRGATAIEYGLIVALISLAVIAGATAVERAAAGNYNLVSNSLHNVTPSG